MQRRKFLASLFKATTALPVIALTGCNESKPSPEPVPPKPEPELKADFNIAILPDTQKYARYSNERYMAQTQWIVDNYLEERIPFTIHVGDIVDRAKEQYEWDNANLAMQTLDQCEGTPYSVLCGNHDLLNPYKDKKDKKLDDSQPSWDKNRESNEPFLEHWPLSRHQMSHTFEDIDNTGFNTYHIFQSPVGQKFLVLSLDWRASKDTVEWAKAVLKKHHDLPCILSTHQLLNIETDGVSPLITDMGVYYWENLIAESDQIFLTVNGHHHGASHYVAKNSYGRDVVIMVVDYQSMFWGGNGMLRTLGFDYSNNKILARSFSPWVMSLPEEKRLLEDKETLEDKMNHFELEMNFKERFSNFNSAIPIVEKGVIAGTEAYWIFDKAHLIPRQGIYIDQSGKGNHLETASTGASAKQLEMTEDAPETGYSKGSLKFSGDRSGGGAKEYLKTSGISLSNADYKKGYTIECYMKLPADWTAAKARWTAMLSHNCSVTQIAKDESERRRDPDNMGAPRYPEIVSTLKDEDASLSLAVSSLNEVQYAKTGDNGESMSGWSWAVDREVWYHVAIVNDGGEIRIFLNQSEAMRNPTKSMPNLLTMAGKDWHVGAASWGGERTHVFYGQIAEMRIVSRPLEESEWLSSVAE